MKTLHDYTDIQKLTPQRANDLIRHIYVHTKDKKAKPDIYFTAVG